MSCPACGHENRPGAKFCEECAAPIRNVCAACGSELRPTAKFCDECGASLVQGQKSKVESAQPQRSDSSTLRPFDSSTPPSSYTPKHLADKILQSKSALEGERKQVTVLFADVKGSMELAEQLDPEQWHTILDRFFEVLTEGVHRFEGTVNQYTGDGIMALFGAPIAHEDHAQRACYAALALRAALRDFARDVKRQHGLDFATRIGINSGEVVVGKIGDNLRMDYTAQGHTVGLAQRMEALASSGSIYLSEHTRKLAQLYFALDDLGDFTLKGATEPVRVYELTGAGSARTRFDLSRARGLSKFVGRAQEISALESALEQALAGNGQVFGVVADAGTGKSRLCFEFAEACRAKGIIVRTTTGVAHGKAVPLLPVLEFYRSIYGITERDDARAARQKIAGTVVQTDESLVASLPLLFDFLGVPDPEKPVVLEPGPERQRALLTLLKRMTLSRSRREPAVILFEDLHWLDEATETFLENLVDAADSSRTLMVVNFRPEYRADWMRRSYYQQLALAPLDSRAFAEMLGETLGADPSLADLVGRIHARSGGNPFFAEEIVLTLIESGALVGAPGAYRLTRGIDALEIPATVQLILAARIDRLGEREKNALQSASVIGREFKESLLARVAGIDTAELRAALRALVQSEFLHETALFPEAEYAFKHPLTQEVAVGSQLRERRARVHAAVAHALLEIHAGKLDEQAALLAHHFESAGDAAEAVRWHERAALWLEGRDPTAGMHHWERLVELAGAEPQSTDQAQAALRACARLVELGTNFGFDFSRGEQLYLRGRALAARLDGPALEPVLLAAFSRFVIGRDAALALEAADEALSMASRVSDAGEYADLMWGVANAIANGRRPADAVATIDAALASGKVTATTPVALAHLLVARAFWLILAGRLIEARPSIDRAADLLAEERAVVVVVRCDLARMLELEARGFPEGSLERIALFLARADASGARFYQTFARMILASAHLFAGRTDASLEAIEPWTGISPEGLRSIVESIRARALLARGEVAAARDLIERMVAGPYVIPRVRATILVVHAEVLIAADASGEQARIESILGEAAGITQRTGVPAARAEICTQRGRLARALGDQAGWERELREALRIYTEMDATGWMERVALELAS
jgi:class 3 adenylate cyclase